jgi:hypothetical protein
LRWRKVASAAAARIDSSAMLPFTHQQFVFVFAVYNGVVWPLQWVAQGLGLAMLVLLGRPSAARHRAAVLLLAAMWLWTGVVYHAVFFSVINPAAPFFGAAFVLQGLLLATAAWRGGLVAARATGGRAVLGWALLVYAVAVYPALGLLLGERALELPAFGLTPCPVALTTLGLLMLSTGPARRWLLVIPLAWAVIGGSAAVLLRTPQDWPLLAAPLLLAIVAIGERLQQRTAAKTP